MKTVLGVVAITFFWVCVAAALLIITIGPSFVDAMCSVFGY